MFNPGSVASGAKRSDSGLAAESLAKTAGMHCWWFPPSFAARVTRRNLLRLALASGVGLAYATWQLSSGRRESLRHPRPLKVFPLTGFQLNQGVRSRVFSELTAWGMVHGFAREGNAVHMLRLMHVATDTQGWDHPDVFSDILAVLTNGAEYARRISKIPILVETPFGVAYRSAPPFAPGAEALRTASTGGIPHVDKVLSVFGELGRGLTMELKPHPGSSTYTVADLASDSIQRMSLSRECEWTLIAYCDYLADGRPWKNCRGETFSPTSIAEHLLSLSAAGGACYGCHRPYALARCVGRERETPGFLSSPAKHACESHLRELSRELERNQRPDGAWDRNSLPSGRADKSGASSSDLPQLEQLLTITGHNLEWMAMVPQDLRPRDKAISMAIEYLLGLLQSRRDDCFHFFWPQTSHALRALVHLSTPVGEPIG